MMDAGSVAFEQSLESALAELASDDSVYAEELRAWYKHTDGHEQYSSSWMASPSKALHVLDC